MGGVGLGICRSNPTSNNVASDRLCYDRRVNDFSLHVLDPQGRIDLYLYLKKFRTFSTVRTICIFILFYFEAEIFK
jgi:hypothetical protein